MATPPSGYFGLHQIAARLGVSRNTVLNMYERYGLFMFRRRVGPRWVWFTNDALLTLWTLGRIKLDRQAWRERRNKKARPSA